jgi:type IV pilus assembly protein PilV
MGAVLKEMGLGPCYRPTRDGGRGAGLIEVLLALLVFSIAMPGLLSVQVLAMQASSEALQRSMAVLVAQDILSRMKANPDEVSSYVGAGFGDGRQLRAPPATDCDQAPCTPLQLAAHDLWRWESLLAGEVSVDGERNAGGLPLPRACISLHGARVTLTIYWRGAGSYSTDRQSECDPRSEGIYDDPALPAGNNRRRRVLTVSSVVEGSFG